MSKKVKFLTYGCQMNVADSERMAARLQTIGYEEIDALDAADLIVINTCCVRETAEDKIYGKIGELKALKRQNPSLIIGVTGCMAQKEGDRLIKRSPQIDFVLGTGRQSELVRIVTTFESIYERAHPFNRHIVDTTDVSSQIADNVQADFTPRGSCVSTFIPIMYGCNNYCTYCIVPHVRGRERSRQPEDIVNEVKAAVDSGYVEITLLGQNVNSYGKDHGRADFAQLLEMISRIDGLRRLRFMTSHPKDLSDAVIDVIAHCDNICEHIHLPVQYGSDRILKAMNRVYTVDQYRRLVEKIRAAIPNVALTTDLIVGFPSETDADFDETLDFVREIRFDAAYTFIYSKRSGTPAATFDDQVDDAVKHDRLNRLMAVQNAISLEINERLRDEVVEVLVEGASKSDENVLTGRTRTNKLVLFPRDDCPIDLIGRFVDVKINQPQTWLLKGTLVPHFL